MSEQNKPFVVTDRRKFTLDGEPRPDADPSTPKEFRAETPAPPTPELKPQPVAEAAPSSQQTSAAAEQEVPEGPTSDQSNQAREAYQATSDRLDTAIRATNPGMDHPPTMNFEQLVQSVYMTALVQLGGGTHEGEQPRVDLIGARQSIDMLGVLEEKTKGNLSKDENRLLESALFDVRMAFLEVTQMLARSAAGRTAGAPTGSSPAGPSIVR